MTKFKELSELFEYPLYYCGGYVRDKLIGITPKDIDISSRNTPEEVKHICQCYDIKTIDTGIKHGTVTIVLDDGVHVEHTTFRKDVSCDGRNATVEYAETPEEDSNRRDFTINAMYINIETGELIDYHNGVEDILERRLRFVGNPVDRIKEDNLRMLRYFRFCNRFGIVPDKDIVDTIAFHSELLNFISKERIREEIDKMLTNYLRYDILLLMTKIFHKHHKFFEICYRMYNTSSKNNKHHLRDNVLEHCHDVYEKGFIWKKEC